MSTSLACLLLFQIQNLPPELRPNVAKLLTVILRKTWITLNLNHPLPEKFKCLLGQTLMRPIQMTKCFSR